MQNVWRILLGRLLPRRRPEALLCGAREECEGSGGSARAAIPKSRPSPTRSSREDDHGVRVTATGTTTTTGTGTSTRNGTGTSTGTHTAGWPTTTSREGSHGTSMHPAGAARQPGVDACVLCDATCTATLTATCNCARADARADARAASLRAASAAA